MQLLIFSLRLFIRGFLCSTLAGGGLKWTRTIDLTLIRRVL